MGTSPKNRMVKVAEGIYRRNGVYIVPVYDTETKKKITHALSGRPCAACGTIHEPGDLAAAKDLKRDLEKAKRHSAARRSQKTVAQWAGHYAGKQWVPGEWLTLVPRKAASTNLHNDSRVRPFARYFAGRTLESITEEEARRFAVESPSTIKETHALMNDACSAKLIEDNPFAGIKSLKREGRKHIVVLNDEEIGMLLGMASAVHGSYGRAFSAMVATAAWSGLRPSELFLLSLEREDHMNYVDVDAGVIHVDWQINQKTGLVTRPKNNSQREVALLPGAEEALRGERKWNTNWQPGLPIFLTKQGKPFNQRLLFYYWNPVRLAFAAALPPGHHLRTREESIANFDFYELRHFFGSKLANPPAGVQPASPYQIASMMGHKDGGQLAMEVYIHTKNEDARTSIRNAWKKAS